jgi:two-component system, NarL family, sensor kinase
VTSSKARSGTARSNPAIPVAESVAARLVALVVLSGGAALAARRTATDEGLGPALSDLAASARSRGTNVSLELPDDIKVSPSVEALLYRVAQEAMRNAVAHSEASYVVIRIAFDAQHCLHLEVSDDGIGMAADRTSADNGNHLGLRLLAELVDGAGGGLDVRSQGGRGTTIHVQVPVP